MNIFASKRGNTAAFPLKPVAAGCAVFLTMLSAAQAQTAEAPAGEGMQSVVVTGIRSGIEAAISIKKNSNSIVEAISAEDIGKLPDSSVAATIARLPGVTAQRSRGTGKPADISVRGLAPSFNGSLLNGREQASTGNARAPEFDLFPAELIGSAMIYKTPDATLVGQGLASTINLNTLQPLDFGKRVLAASGRKERNGVRSGQPEGDGHRYSFSYVDQFMNRTIGVSLGVTKEKVTGGGQAKFEGGGTTKLNWNGAEVVVPSGFKADTETTASDRTGVSATFQYRPNKEFKTTVDVFHSSGSNSLKKTGLEGSIAGSWGGYDPVGALTAATVANGIATSGTMSGFKGDVRNHMEMADDKLNSVGWNTQWKTAGWTFIADLSHSKGEKDAVRFETTAGQAGNTPEAQVGNISWTNFDGANLAGMTLTPGWNYADRTKTFLTDHAGWGGGPNSPQAGYVAMPKVVDKVDSIRLSGKQETEWGPVSAMQYGFNHTKRNKVRSGEEGRLVVKGGDGYATATVPGSDVATAGTTGIPIVSFNPVGSLGSIYNMVQWIDAGVLAKDWAVTEKVSTVFAMADLDGELSGIPYRGNVGAQYVHTSQSTEGNKVDLATCTGITAATCPFTKRTDGTSYNDFLPSANISFDVGNDQLVRLSAAKVLARANLDDMRASSAFGLKRVGGLEILTGEGGNAKLEPFRAKAVDLSYEKYFGQKKGYVSAAVFYKKLDTYVLRAPREHDFKDQITPGTQLPQTGPYAGSTVGLLTTPLNGDGGSIKGYELALNIPFSLATQYLDGFGVMLNHSNTSSNLELPKDGFATKDVSPTSIPLPGLSKKVSNLRLYYEKHGFQVAWAARKRSDFLGQISDYQDNAQLTFVRGDTIIDLQASYEFKDGWLKGLSMFVNANNWNNEPYREYNGVDRNAFVFKTTYGRTYQFGASYKF